MKVRSRQFTKEFQERRNLYKCTRSQTTRPSNPSEWQRWKRVGSWRLMGKHGGQGDGLGTGEKTVLQPQLKRTVCEETRQACGWESQQGGPVKANEEVWGSRACHEPSLAVGDGLFWVTVGCIWQPKQQPETLQRKANLLKKERGTIIRETHADCSHLGGLRKVET